MYSTCLFCNQSLGTNQAIESFPVGRRLAFDAAKGRLWVVCRKCERWNLSPMEERWEAIEECERLFRSTRTRVSTEEIGLARLAEGLELVRIGRPLRPEFAAWRYGDQFGRRRRRTILMGTGAAVVFGGILIGGAATGVISGIFLGQAGNIVNVFVNSRTVVKVRRDDGRILKLKKPDVDNLKILPPERDGRFTLTLGRGKRLERFEGDEAERVASVVIPKLNSLGGTQQTVREAVHHIEQAGGPEPFLENVLHDLGRNAARAERALSRREKTEHTRKSLIVKLPGPTRLAIEMALHEERERRALEGELRLLEIAWREAEEVAAISDDLLLPPGARELIQREAERWNAEQLKRERSGASGQPGASTD